LLKAVEVRPFCGPLHEVPMEVKRGRSMRVAHTLGGSNGLTVEGVRVRCILGLMKWIPQIKRRADALEQRRDCALR